MQLRKSGVITFAAMIIGFPFSDAVAHDGQKKCTSVFATDLLKTIVATIYTQGNESAARTEATELHFKADHKNISEIRLTFREPVGSSNYSTCANGRLTIPFGYGQLPLILNLWNSRVPGKRRFFCQTTTDTDLNGNEFIDGRCNLE